MKQSEDKLFFFRKDRHAAGNDSEVFLSLDCCLIGNRNGGGQFQKKLRSTASVLVLEDVFDYDTVLLLKKKTMTQSLKHNFDLFFIKRYLFKNDIFILL
jgi:hypothetical protein